MKKASTVGDQADGLWHRHVVAHLGLDLDDKDAIKSEAKRIVGIMQWPANDQGFTTESAKIAQVNAWLAGKAEPRTSEHRTAFNQAIGLPRLSKSLPANHDAEYAAACKAWRDALEHYAKASGNNIITNVRKVADTLITEGHKARSALVNPRRLGAAVTLWLQGKDVPSSPELHELFLKAVGVNDVDKSAITAAYNNALALRPGRRAQEGGLKMIHWTPQDPLTQHPCITHSRNFLRLCFAARSSAFDSAEGESAIKALSEETGIEEGYITSLIGDHENVARSSSYLPSAANSDKILGWIDRNYGDVARDNYLTLLIADSLRYVKETLQNRGNLGAASESIPTAYWQATIARANGKAWEKFVPEASRPFVMDIRPEAGGTKGEYLYALRHAAGLSPDDVDQALDLDWHAVNKVENNSKIHPGTYTKLLAYYRSNPLTAKLLDERVLDTLPHSDGSKRQLEALKSMDLGDAPPAYTIRTAGPGSYTVLERQVEPAKGR